LEGFKINKNQGQFIAGMLLGIGMLIGCTSTTETNQVSVNQWLDAPAVEQAQAISQGELSSEALVAGYLARIAKVDKTGPTINSILALNPNALAEARIRDAEVAAGNIRGPLHGIPVLVKDNIETKELATTAGSLALLNNDTHRDAPIIANLRAAGAIILGKTNLSEWANFRSNNSISGWSGVGGLTRNPHMLSRSACGSSSGSAAAMTAGLASLAIGTETNGSITCPSSMNGIVGFKPTVGLLSRTHIVPISVTQDTAGPMTRSVKDAALMASVMASTDSEDEATVNAQRPVADTLIPTTTDLSGMRIGVVRFRQGDNPQILAAFQQSLTTLESLGATLIEITDFQQPDDFWQKANFVSLAEFKTTINDYLRGSTGDITTRSLSDLIAFNEASAREQQLFDQSVFLASNKTQGMDDPAYPEALALIRQATRSQGIDKMLQQAKVDVLVAPSNNPAFIIDAVYGDNAPTGFIGIGYLAAIGGYPQITVPMAEVKHLPVGISFLASAWHDAEVLKVAYAYEQTHQFLLAPDFAINSGAKADIAEAFKPMKQ
jgi:amidase